jgi:hypothetical protein
MRVESAQKGWERGGRAPASLPRVNLLAHVAHGNGGAPA